MISDTTHSLPVAGDVSTQPQGSRAGRIIRAGGTESAVILLFIGAALFLYRAALLTQYGYADDYNSLANFTRARHAFRFSAAMGRPLSGLVAAYLPRAFHPFGLRSLPTLRFISIVGLGLIAWSIYRALRRARWPGVMAAMVGFAVCTLPSSQVYAAWASCMPCPYAGFLGALGALAGWSAMSYFEQGRFAGAVAFAFGAVLLFVAGISFYQPAAMLFCAVAVIDLLRPSFDLSRVTIRRAVGYAGIGMAGLFCGWIVFHIGATAYPWIVQPGRGGVAIHPIDKVHWFFAGPLCDVLNLANIFPSLAMTRLLGAGIVVGLALYFRGSMAARVVGMVLAGVAVPIAHLPNLLAQENWPSYRTQMALGVLVLLLAFFALNGAMRFLNRPVVTTCLIAVGTGAAAILASRTVTKYIIAPQAIELALVRAAVVAPGEARSRTVYLIAPEPSDYPLPEARYDEFGKPSTSASWAQREIVSDVRQDAFGPGVRTEVTVLTADAAAKLSPDSVLLDMRKLRAGR